MPRCPLLHLLLLLWLSTTLAAATGCSSSSGNAANDNEADSLRRVDSIARAETRRDSLRRDSLRRDSIMHDSIFEANALHLNDFIAAGSNRFLSEASILENLRRKDFEILTTEKRTNGDGIHVTDYRLFADGDTLSTSVSLRYSEPYSPIMITFVDDRETEIFVTSLSDNGFYRDQTGNYVHSSNTPWEAAVVTVSGRRIFIEWTSAD